MKLYKLITNLGLRASIVTLFCKSTDTIYNCNIYFRMNFSRGTDTIGMANSSFNRPPGMENYEIIILLAFYSIVCLAVLVLNYLTLRALITIKAPLPRQRPYVCYLATIDLAVGVVSIPSYLYNMFQWPFYTFFVYEAFDCLSGFASSFFLAALSVKILRETFKASKRYADHPRTRTIYFIMAGSIVIAGGLAALNVTSLMGFIPFSIFFYFTAGAVGAVFTIFFITFSVVLLSFLCGKDHKKIDNDQKMFRKSVLISSAITFFTWNLPFLFFTFNFFCEACLSLPTMFLYIARFLLYAKSFLMPVGYFRSSPLLSKVLRKILTRDCLGIPFTN